MVRIPQVIVDQRRRNAVILSQHRNCLQLQVALGIADPLPGRWQPEGPGLDEANFAGRLAAYPLPGTLYLPRTPSSD